MAFPSIHRPFAIEFPDVANRYLTRFTDYTAAQNFNSFSAFAAGDSAPGHSGSYSAAPDFRFRTPDIKRVLDECVAGQDGIVREYTGGTLAMYWRKAKNRGLREALDQTVHNRFDCANNAFMYWEQITATAGEAAEIQARILAVSTDGDTAPMVAVGSSVLPADISVVGDIYVLGPMYVNGVLVDSSRSANFDLQIQADEEIDGGSQWQTYGAVDTETPRLLVETWDQNVHNVFGSSGTPLTSLSFYLRKQLASGILVPKATAEHIKITASAGTVLAQQATGVKSLNTVEIMADRPDETTPPFTVNTAVAITT